jgi:phage-related protein
MQGRLVRIVELLERWGPQRVGMPYTRPLGQKLWEMRVSGRAGIARVIYAAASGRRLVMLHAFIKKTEKTPSRAIVRAERRLKELKQ